MKKHPVPLVAGGILILIFLCLLFVFQVRQTEVAVVTTFGRASSTRIDPGPYFRLPWPIQRIYRFDKRIRNFERRFEQTTTSDGRNLVVTVFVAWRIADPGTFLNSFDGDVTQAEINLENMVRGAKNGVIGQHPFSDLINTRVEELRFDRIENEMLAAIRDPARDFYGIEVRMVGIKKLGLPESNTGKVFERMREERMRLVKRYQGEGEGEAIRIRAEADRQQREILARAEAEATIMTGQAEAEATQYYQVFAEEPELAVFLMRLRALREAVADRTTLILDADTPPFDLLKGGMSALPGPDSRRNGAMETDPEPMRHGVFVPSEFEDAQVWETMDPKLINRYGIDPDAVPVRPRRIPAPERDNGSPSEPDAAGFPVQMDPEVMRYYGIDPDAVPVRPRRIPAPERDNGSPSEPDAAGFPVQMDPELMSRYGINPDAVPVRPRRDPAEIVNRYGIDPTDGGRSAGPAEAPSAEASPEPAEQGDPEPAGDQDEGDGGESRESREAAAEEADPATP